MTESGNIDNSLNDSHFRLEGVEALLEMNQQECYMLLSVSSSIARKCMILGK